MEALDACDAAAAVGHLACQDVAGERAPLGGLCLGVVVLPEILNVGERLADTR